MEQEKQKLITQPWPVDLGDGKQRWLKYMINTTQGLQKKYGSMKALMANEIPSVLPELLMVGLVDEQGKPTGEFTDPGLIGDMMPMPFISPAHDAFLTAFYGYDVVKLRAEAEAKKRLADPNLQSQTTSQ